VLEHVCKRGCVEELFPYPALICHAEMLPVRSAPCIFACRARNTCASAVEWRRGTCEVCGPDRLVPPSALCNFKKIDTILIDTPHLVLNTGRTRTIAHGAAVSFGITIWGLRMRGWGKQNYCRKSPAIRTHASNRRTRPPTKVRLASVSIDLNLKGEARVEGARSEVFRVTKSCALIYHIHTHPHKHTNHPRCQSASGCCTRATPLCHVYTIGTSHHHVHRTESR